MSGSSQLPKGFVYIHDVNPTIISSLRYFTSENFVGKRLEGYRRNSSAILTAEAANALSVLQEYFLSVGFSIVIYDTYRPQKAVNNMVSWCYNTSELKTKAKYYPRIDKTQILHRYVASKSGHSRGSTVDITLIPSGQLPHRVNATERVLNDGSKILYLDDGTVDMGSSFDLFDEASTYNSNLVPAECLRMRQFLRNQLVRFGFVPLNNEWWHFTLKDEPFPNTYFDFDVL